MRGAAWLVVVAVAWTGLGCGSDPAAPGGGPGATGDTGAGDETGPATGDETGADTRADTGDETGADEPAGCLEVPALADGPAIELLKYPYLQSPTGAGVIVAFETDLEVAATVVVWGADPACPVAVETTTPTQMDTWYEAFEIELDQPPGWQQAAEVGGLEPGAWYQYTVRAGSTETTPRTFRAPPARGQPFTVAIQGDNRTHDDDHARVVDGILDTPPDMVVNTGDMVTAGGQLENWEGFFAIESELIAEAPLLPCFGNHEAAFGDPYYKGYFHVPSPADESDKDYAFGYGDAYWIVYDTMRPVTDERLIWMDARLAEAQAYPYRFVVAHHPFFTFSNHEPLVSERERLHPRFVDAGIQVVWNGHNHCYERFLVDGIHYVVTGGGGSSLYGAESNIVEEEAHLRVAYAVTHHFVRLDVEPEGATAAVWDVDGETFIDDFEVAPHEVAAE